MVTLRNIDGGTDMKKSSETPFLLGATLSTINSELASKLHIKGGVVVKELKEGKLLSAGVKEGFVITKINHQTVHTVEDLKLLLSSASRGIYLEGVYANGIRAAYAFGM
jgi:S1-C subfamily serine protease